MTGFSFGLAALRIAPPYHTAWAFDTALDTARGAHFYAWERHWFSNTAEGWAFMRERELRDERQAREREALAYERMWDWPSAP